MKPYGFDKGCKHTYIRTDNPIAGGPASAFWEPRRGGEGQAWDDDGSFVFPLTSTFGRAPYSSQQQQHGHAWHSVRHAGGRGDWAGRRGVRGAMIALGVPEMQKIDNKYEV